MFLTHTRCKYQEMTAEILIYHLLFTENSEKWETFKVQSSLVNYQTVIQPNCISPAEKKHSKKRMQQFDNVTGLLAIIASNRYVTKYYLFSKESLLPNNWVLATKVLFTSNPNFGTVQLKQMNFIAIPKQVF